MNCDLHTIYTGKWVKKLNTKSYKECGIADVFIFSLGPKVLFKHWK